ncbi:MAG: tetratricopeptide repeat protein, partial [Bacteroidota bacterium]
MKNPICFLLICLLLGPMSAHAQYILPGQLTLQNSGNTPVVGASVTAPPWANTTLSDAGGQFALSFTGKKAGYEALLSIEKEGYEVVNKKELLHTLTADPQPVRLYLCPQGEWQENAISYYQINEANLTRRYREEIDRVQEVLADNQAMMYDSLARLEELYRGALSQAQELAEQFAIANLDDATDLYEEAFGYFKEGKIQEAIDLLTDTRLEQQLKGITEEIAEGKEMIAIGEKKVVNAQEALDQGIENYLLKADLLVLDFRFDEAEENFVKAVEVDTMRFASRFGYAYFLQVQNKVLRAIPEYQSLLTLELDSIQRSTTINNLAILLSQQNDFKAAMQAFNTSLAMQRQLARKHPNVFLPFVATTLNNRATVLADQYNLNSSISDFQEALTIYREASQSQPALYLPDVAMTLANLGNTQTQLFDYKNGIPAYKEALGLYRQLVQKDSLTFAPSLAGVLHNLGYALCKQNEYQKGVEAYEEALEIRQNLSKKNPDAYLPDLANTLGNLGIAYCDLDRLAEGEAFYEEALVIYERLSEKNGVRYAADLGRILNSLGQALCKQGEYAKGTQSYEKAIEIYQSLAEHNPDVYTSDLAMTLNNLGNAQIQQNDYLNGIS